MGNKQVAGIYSAANQQSLGNQEPVKKNVVFGEPVYPNKDKDVAKDKREDEAKDTAKHIYDFTHLPTADEVEDMMYKYRKEDKTRINGNLPESWKEEIDAYCTQVNVGKYALVQYAIGKLLKKV